MEVMRNAGGAEPEYRTSCGKYDQRMWGASKYQL